MSKYQDALRKLDERLGDECASEMDTLYELVALVVDLEELLEDPTPEYKLCVKELKNFIRLYKRE